MKRVLVTGATGFIGQHTIPVLQEMGYEVFQCSRKDDCDILKPAWVKDLITRTRPTHLLHLAWDVTDGYMQDFGRNQMWANQSARMVGAFADQGGKRVVIAGTQRNPEINKTPYGYWKNELNRQSEQICHDEGVSYACGRIYYLYGQGERRSRLVPYIINTLMDGGEPKYSDKAIDIMYSKDVAAALCHILDSRLQGNADIGTGKPIPIYYIESIARTLMALPQREYREVTDHGYPADTSALDSIGWHPRYALDEGLQETIEWWKA